MGLEDSIAVSASGLRAQAVRMRIIAENLANKDSVAETPGADPYRRKTVSFRSEVDRELGASVVAANRIGVDRSAFGRTYQPGHPAADKDGYVATSNVNSLVEMTDMTEAQRSYEANLSAIEAAKSLTMRTIDLLR
jgi:flagellar basal-body rod protein FlgC